MFGQWWPDWPGDAGAGLEPCGGAGLVPWAGTVGDALGPTSGAGVGVAANAAIENAMTVATAASGPASSCSSRFDIWTSASAVLGSGAHQLKAGQHASERLHSLLGIR